jgi:6-phosphogluconolactonase
MLIKHSFFSPFVILLFTASLYAQSFVYTNNNPSGPNSVTAFSVGSNGALTQIPGSPFLTGGRGNGVGFVGSNLATICAAGDRIYISNNGDNSVTGFDINPVTGTLALVPGSPFNTGGLSGLGISLACTPNGQFLIAANAQSSNITVFSIASNGALAPVLGSPFPVGFPGGSLPQGIKVSPDGKFLAVSLRSNGPVAMFNIGPGGELTPVPGSPFPLGNPNNPSIIDINCASSFAFVAESNNHAAIVGVFSIGPNGALTQIEGSPFIGPGVDSEVVLLSPNQQFLFVSDLFTTCAEFGCT